MKYLVLDNFKAQTAQGEREIKAGQVIDLKEDKTSKLISSKKIKAVPDVMQQEYQSLITWLKSNKTLAADIQEAAPDIYTNIQNAIDKMDACMVALDMSGFQNSLENIRSLYIEGMGCISVN